MKNKIAELKSADAAKKALSDHRADRQANRDRREELNNIIADAKEEMRLLEAEYQAGTDDETDLLIQLGKITAGMA